MLRALLVKTEPRTLLSPLSSGARAGLCYDFSDHSTLLFWPDATLFITHEQLCFSERHHYFLFQFCTYPGSLVFILHQVAALPLSSPSCRPDQSLAGRAGVIRARAPRDPLTSPWQLEPRRLCKPPRFSHPFCTTHHLPGFVASITFHVHTLLRSSSAKSHSNPDQVVLNLRSVGLTQGHGAWDYVLEWEKVLSGH